MQNLKNFKGLGSFFLSILAALTIRWGVAEAYVIPSGSMEPTLEVNDRIFVNKLAYGLRLPFTKTWISKFETPRRGDVIVFKYPKDESTFYVKRVIGLPGDEIVYTEEGQIFVNGKRLDESTYETKLQAGWRAREFGPITVPLGQLFAMGDNRDNSSDSRTWGFVPQENIMGRATVKWWGNVR